MIVLKIFTFCTSKYFCLLLTQATAQAVHILSHPSVGKIICSLVEAGKVTRHTCPYMSHWTNCYEGRKRWRPRVTSEAAGGKWGGSGPALELQIVT